MNQYKKIALLWVLLLAICTALLSGCINALPEDFYITTSAGTTKTPDVTVSTPPEEISPEETTAEEIPSEVTTAEQTPPEQSTPQQTPPEDTTFTTPKETTTEQPSEVTTPTEKIKIYIDQGHNPFSPTHPPSWNTGASNEELGLYEQDLTYEIGILLAQLLAQDDRFEVRLSRPTAETILGTDQSSALDARINDAEEWGANYFISLHINDFKKDLSISGLEFCYAPNDIVGKELGTVLIDSLAESTGLRKRPEKIRDDIRVLVNTTMPATLLEMGFISNEGDAKLLDESPELFAQGIYNGILSYFDTLEVQSAEESITE